MAQRNLTSVLLLSFALVVMPLLRPTVAIGQTVDAASDASQTAAPEPLTDEEMEVLVAHRALSGRARRCNGRGLPLSGTAR